MTIIGHILGDWSRNIGNAFFQLGGQWALNQALPQSKMILINEQPGYPSYWNPFGGNPRNTFDTPSALDVDYLVLMGPMFRPETEKIWGTSLQKVLAKGTRLVLLGMGAMKYDPENIELYRSFLKKYPPYLFTSRDRETFERLGDLATHSYDGIDFGFFMPEVYSPCGFDKDFGEFIAMNFDKIPEPVLSLSKIDAAPSHNIKGQTFEFDGWRWEAGFSGFRKFLGETSRYTMFLEGLLFQGSRPAEIGPYKVLRTDHRPHPMIKKKTYRYPNTIVNDTPYIYMEVYSQAALTLTDRVHAGVIALSYGKPAMVFSKTPRIRLLNRLGVNEITTHPVMLNHDFLQAEKDKLVSFLREHLT